MADVGDKQKSQKKPDSQLQRLYYRQIEKRTTWQTLIFRDTVDRRNPAPPQNV